MGTMFAALSTWGLGKVAGLVPGLRTALLWAGATALLVAGVLFGIWVHAATEGPRIAREAKARVKASNLETEVVVLKGATRQQSETLALRDRALEASDKYIKQLEEDLANARTASSSSDVVVIPPGDPWLRAGPKR